MIKTKIIDFLAEVGAIKRVNIRILGENKLWIGRVIQGLIKDGQVEEFKVGTTTYIRLSLMGYRKAFGYIKTDFSFEQKKKEQESDSTSLLYIKTCSERSEQSFEPIKKELESDNTSLIPIKNRPAQEERQRLRQRAYESILRRASMANNKSKRERYEREIEILAYFYRYWKEGVLGYGLTNTLKPRYIEMNDIKKSDEKQGMLIRGSRGHGILELEKGIYVLYNSKTHRMKKAPLNEDKLNIYLERRFGKRIIGTLVIGSERVIRQLYSSDTRGHYVGENEEKTKGIRIGEDGAKQFGIYIYQTRIKLREKLISPQEQEKATSYIYDGLSKNSEAKYIAIEEDLYEIKAIRETAMIQGVSRLEVYCFDWQKERILWMLEDVGIPITVRTLKEQDILKNDF